MTIGTTLPLTVLVLAWFMTHVIAYTTALVPIKVKTKRYYE